MGPREIGLKKLLISDQLFKTLITAHKSSYLKLKLETIYMVFNNSIYNLY